jgi:hypothetical protein
MRVLIPGDDLTILDPRRGATAARRSDVSVAGVTDAIDAVLAADGSTYVTRSDR